MSWVTGKRQSFCTGPCKHAHLQGVHDRGEVDKGLARTGGRLDQCISPCLERATTGHWLACIRSMTAPRLQVRSWAVRVSSRIRHTAMGLS